MNNERQRVLDESRVCGQHNTISQRPQHNNHVQTLTRGKRRSEAATAAPPQQTNNRLTDSTKNKLREILHIRIIVKMKPTSSPPRFYVEPSGTKRCLLCYAEFKMQYNIIIPCVVSDILFVMVFSRIYDLSMTKNKWQVTWHLRSCARPGWTMLPATDLPPRTLQVR